MVLVIVSALQALLSLNNSYEVYYDYVMKYTVHLTLL